MNVSTAIRIGYFSILSGNVTSNATVVPVYDAFSVPPTAMYPYIIIGSQTEAERRIKHQRAYVATVMVEIVTGSIVVYGRRQSEDIEAQVEQLINPIDGNIDITANGFKIGDTEREQSFDQQSKEDVYYIYIKRNRYRHLVEKI